MKKAFESDYATIVSRAKKNPNCKIKAFKNYAFVKCHFSKEKTDYSYFVQRIENSNSAEGFLLESEDEKSLFKKIYFLFSPDKIEIISDLSK